MRNLILVILISPFLMQGLCNKEDIKLACTDIATWDGSAKDGFYQSNLQDSHFRDLYFKAIDAPVDICPDAEIQAFFSVPSVSGVFIHNINRIEGKIFWGDQQETVTLSFSDTDHAYVGTIERINVKPYFDEHPTANGAAIIEAHLFWYNLSVGSEQSDLKYVTDNVTDMNIRIQYIRE